MGDDFGQKSKTIKKMKVRKIKAIKCYKLFDFEAVLISINYNIERT